MDISDLIPAPVLDWPVPVLILGVSLLVTFFLELVVGPNKRGPFIITLLCVGILSTGAGAIAANIHTADQAADMTEADTRFAARLESLYGARTDTSFQDLLSNTAQGGVARAYLHIGGELQSAMVSRAGNKLSIEVTEGDLPVLDGR